MTAHAAILKAIAIVQEAQSANTVELGADLPRLAWRGATWWNEGAEAVALETIDRLNLLADELQQSELQVVDGVS